MSKLECNIVQDLLPSFADSLVSEKTEEEIKEHLSACENCSGIYNEMVKGENIEQKEDKNEINYLRKIKNRNKKMLASILAVFMLLIAIAFGLYSFIGVEDAAYSVNNIYVTDHLVSAKILLFSSSNNITKVSAKEADGIVTISVKSSLFSLSKKDSADFAFIVDETISKVQTYDGRVLWENGEAISQKINDIYNAKVKYIGDNSAVSHLLSAININDTLKCENYAIHLLTDEKPYGLEIYDINSYDEMFSSFTDESYEQKIKTCAFIILACIENADFVQFEYTTPGGMEKTYKLTIDEANDYLGVVSKGENIKDFANSHWELKTLIDTVGTQLLISSQFEYIPYLIENEEIVDKISNNPIDQKYLDIQNNTPCFDIPHEYENYLEWAEAYEKQYKIIYKTILDYAENIPDSKDYIKEDLIEKIKAIEDYGKYNDRIADLFYTCESFVAGMGSNRQGTYCWVYLCEAREKTLRLAELAYFLNVDFEWVEQ